MSTHLLSSRTPALLRAMEPIMAFLTKSAWAKRRGEPNTSDFTIGNPHEMPLPDYVDALQRWVVPQNESWYAYKRNESYACRAVADSLRSWRGVEFEEEDIFMTNGSISALAVVFNLVADPGDEVIFISPPWFQYEAMIINAGAMPVRVRVNPETFDLDLDAVERAISSRTRGIIINSPHNPTGKIYPPETLRALSRILTRGSERNGRAIYLISDEAYSRIVYDGREYHSPTAYYHNSFLVYTYGKVLLTPGERIGFIALPPQMSDRGQIRPAILNQQMLLGWAFPNALLQYAIADIDQLSIDVAHIQKKRDRIVKSLKVIGYETSLPEGAFYVLVRSPWADDYAFVELLAEHDIFCMPGSLMDIPGYFRISLTANDAMIERALAGFEKAIKIPPR